MKTTVCTVYNNQPAVGTKFQSSLDSLKSSEVFATRQKNAEHETTIKHLYANRTP